MAFSSAASTSTTSGGLFSSMSSPSSSPSSSSSSATDPSSSSSPPSSSSIPPTEHVPTTGRPAGVLARLWAPFATQRARRQAALFFLGAAGVVFSSSVTRRALAARYRAMAPRPFTSSMEVNAKFNGPAEAVQALSLATLNVSSIALMMTGGALWALDISTVDEMRRLVRGGLGADGSGRNENEVEEDFEEWVATMLSRKEQREAARKRAGLDPKFKNERGKER